MTDTNHQRRRRSATGAPTASRSKRGRRSRAALNGATNDNGRSGDGRAAALPVFDDGLYLTPDAESALYNRLSRLEGQVRGVKKMLAEHKSCDDMLVQIAALKQAVNGVAAELVQAHMETCVLGRVEAGEGKQALASLRSALAKVMKHG